MKKSLHEFTKKTLPKFKNIAEEAQFWDIHDTTDYPEIWKPAEEKFVRKDKVVAVRNAQPHGV